MKYFVISDLHGYYTLFKESLDKSGYSVDDPNHALVVLGDIFDRGEECREIYNFLKDIPQERVVLVRGNHDYLLFQLLRQDLPDDIGYGNGTVLTACQMAYKTKESWKTKYQALQDLDYTRYFLGSSTSNLRSKWKTVVKRVLASDMYKWFTSSQWVNYWEIDKFVGVHSFVPVLSKGCYIYKKMLSSIYYGDTQYFSPSTEWREASSSAWELATWGCPYVFMDAGFFPEEGEKTLICGHYRADAFHAHYEPETSKSGDFSIYYSKKIIAIDGTVAYSKRANVLVIDENGDCYDQDGKKLSD